jgi:hypothetical protein
MAKKPTAADAELCIKLYDLRREEEMRKAREFVNFQFQPKGADDILQLMMAFGTKENAWARQVFSYWESAASLVLNEVVHPALFLAWNGEMVFVYAKYGPYLKEMRQKMENPTFWDGVEKVVTGSPEMKKRLGVIQKRLAKMAGQAAGKKK